MPIPNDPESAAPAGNPTPSLQITGSRQFTSWLAEQSLSLAFTTYQAGKLFSLARRPMVSSRCLSAPLSAAWACGCRAAASGSAPSTSSGG